MRCAGTSKVTDSRYTAYWRGVKAYSLEYRLRYPLHVLVYVLGIWAPWERYGGLRLGLSLGGSTAWTALATILARQHWLGFAEASRLLLVGATAAAILAALLRVWGSSYLGAAVVHSGSMHARHVLGDGPFRFVRNPLYLGTILNALALALLMPLSGAVVAIMLIVVLQLRLIGAEEAFLTEKLGATYNAYCRAVPRLLPSLRPRIPAAGDTPHPLTGVLSELYFVGAAISFAAFGSTYNATLILEGVLVGLGASLIARAFLPAPVRSAPMVS